MFLPHSANSRLFPERKPSPTPTRSSKDPTPQAIPNIVRKERSLCAQRLRRIWRKISDTVLMTAHDLDRADSFSPPLFGARQKHQLASISVSASRETCLQNQIELNQSSLVFFLRCGLPLANRPFFNQVWVRGIKKSQPYWRVRSENRPWPAEFRIHPEIDTGTPSGKFHRALRSANTIRTPTKMTRSLLHITTRTEFPLFQPDLSRK